jgi:hypothetical protein
MNLELNLYNKKGITFRAYISFTDPIRSGSPVKNMDIVKK